MPDDFALLRPHPPTAIAVDQLLAWFREFEACIVKGSPVAYGGLCAIAVDFLPARVAADVGWARGADNPGSQ